MAAVTSPTSTTLGGSNQPVSIRSRIDAFSAELGKLPIIEQHPFHEADTKDTQAAIGKAKTLLDGSPAPRPRKASGKRLIGIGKHHQLARDLSL